MGNDVMKVGLACALLAGCGFLYYKLQERKKKRAEFMRQKLEQEVGATSSEDKNNSVVDISEESTKSVDELTKDLEAAVKRETPGA